MKQLLLLSCLLLTACDQNNTYKDAPMNPLTNINARLALPDIHVNKNASMNPLTDINVRLAFTCQHQTIPEASADTNILFN